MARCYSEPWSPTLHVEALLQSPLRGVCMSHSTTRLRRPLTVSVVAAAGLSLALAPLAHAAGGTDRIAGEDRYETAVKVSNLAVSEDGSADAVVLARG